MANTTIAAAQSRPSKSRKTANEVEGQKQSQPVPEKETQKVIEPAVAPAALDAAHQAFSWLHSSLQNNPNAQFAALTMDFARGIRTCLELVQMSELDRTTEVTPCLDINDTERLLRLSIVCAAHLGDLAEFRIDAIEKLDPWWKK